MKRSAMTIMEIMFAIMITSVGLLGAISVFPVASEMARKGRLNDEVAISADAAVHKFDAMGMRQPSRWIAFVDQSATSQPAQAVNGLALPAAFTWKTSYCIDPRFTAANMTAHSNAEQQWTRFPAFPQSSPASPRMQRLTLNSGVGTAMPSFQADSIFSFEDRLIYGRPGVERGRPPVNIADPNVNDNSLPAYQIYSRAGVDSNGKPVPGKRDSDGTLTWMATLCPKIDLLTGSQPDSYVLSIVVFDRRSPSLTTRDFTAGPIAPPFAGDIWPDNEWVVNISATDFYGNGYGGGEVRLNADFAEKLTPIKSGSWVMLAVNAPAIPDATGSPTTTASIFRWYKISDIDDLDTATIGGSARFVRNATLVGADFDTFGNDVEVTVMPGVIAVQERTVRLEQ